MENASKALIIAGSILLSILIIALGMYIFSTSSSTSNVEILNETEVQTFNAKFEKYKGEQLGTNVDALLKALRTNYTANKKSSEKLPGIYYFDMEDKNKDNPTSGKYHYVTYDETKDRSNDETYTKVISKIQSEISNSHRYTVSIDYNSKTGLVEKITIKY